MERKRNRPEKYDRQLVHKTVKSMQKVEEVRAGGPGGRETCPRFTEMCLGFSETCRGFSETCQGFRQGAYSPCTTPLNEERANARSRLA